FFAFDPGPGYLSGVQVATADVNNDGIPDIIVGSGAGRVGEVRVFDGASAGAAMLDDFFPEGGVYRNGLNVAAGDVDADGNVDIITSRARGVSQVRVFQNVGG